MCKRRFIGGGGDGSQAGSLVPRNQAWEVAVGRRKRRKECIGRARENIERDRKEMGPKCLHYRGKSLGGGEGLEAQPLAWKIQGGGCGVVWCGVPGMPCNR